jgi:hypothetical protein
MAFGNSGPGGTEMSDLTENIAGDIEPDALREAEFVQARDLLHNLVGRRIAEVRVEDTRIAIVADDGATYFFYGFMGESLRDEDEDS